MNLIKIISGIIASFGVLIAAFVSGKRSSERANDFLEKKSLDENIRLNDQVRGMDFNDRSDFLLSKQRNKDS